MSPIEQIAEAAMDVRDDAKESARNASDHAEHAAYTIVATAFDRFIDQIHWIEKREIEARLACIAEDRLA